MPCAVPDRLDEPHSTIALPRIPAIGEHPLTRWLLPELAGHGQPAENDKTPHTLSIVGHTEQPRVWLHPAPVVAYGNHHYHKLTGVRVAKTAMTGRFRLGKVLIWSKLHPTI